MSIRFITLAAAVAIAAFTAVKAQETDSLTHELQELIVTSDHPVTRLDGNTLVSTIVGSGLQNIGTAADVLGQLPLMSVDTDGAVSITGRGTPEIYIDGRPMRDSDELIRLQSDNIKRVELILAPGAAYGSDTRAVVRIVTRRNFLAGLSLTERAEASVRRKLSANDMLDINYRVGSWDFFASASVARNNSVIKGSTVNSLDYEGRPTVVGSSQHASYPSTNGTVRGGFNHSAGNRSFGAYYRYNPECANFTNHGSEWLDDTPEIDRDIDRRIHSHSHLASAYYDETFGSCLVHFDGDYRHALSDENSATVYPDASATDVFSSSRRHSSLWAGKLYTEFPLAGGRFTAGTQNSHTRTSLDYLMLNPDIESYIPSSKTDVRQTSAAVFASWSRTFGPLSLTAGLRYEYLDHTCRLNGVTDPELSRRDHLLTPDISIGYNFDERSSLTLSYKASTVKPPYSQLTGSLIYTGLHEIEGGNPALRDERMHDLQLFGSWRDFMLVADFTRSIDTYSFVKRIYPAPSLQLLMQPVNIDVSAIDLYLVWERNIRRWTPTLTLGLHRQWLDIGATRYNKPIFSYYFDNIINLPRGFMLTVSANGQTSGDMHTNRFGTTAFAMNLSLGKSFLNRSLHVKLSATDIFNSLNNDWSMKTFGVSVDKRQSYDRRGLTLSLTYRLRPQKSKYKGESAAGDELRRL